MAAELRAGAVDAGSGQLDRRRPSAGGSRCPVTSTAPDTSAPLRLSSRRSPPRLLRDRRLRRPAAAPISRHLRAPPCADADEGVHSLLDSGEEHAALRRRQLARDCGRGPPERRADRPRPRGRRGARRRRRRRSTGCSGRRLRSGPCRTSRQGAVDRTATSTHRRRRRSSWVRRRPSTTAHPIRAPLRPTPRRPRRRQHRRRRRRRWGSAWPAAATARAARRGRRASRRQQRLRSGSTVGTRPPPRRRSLRRRRPPQQQRRPTARTSPTAPAAAAGSHAAASSVPGGTSSPATPMPSPSQRTANGTPACAWAAGAGLTVRESRRSRG